MKKCKLLIWACLFLPFAAFSQGGVNFRDLTFGQALEAAEKEGKLVFMDCYTSWCAPCKVMLSKVFTREEAGKYFNPRFVSVKFDMEKGEGVELAERFGVHSYPTFLLIRPDGNVQHRLIGASGLEEFIARVDKGLNEATSLWLLDSLSKEGNLTKEQLAAYHAALMEAGERKKATWVFGELWGRLTDEEKTSPKYWTLYEDPACTIGSPAFDFLLSRLDEVRENVGWEHVDDFLTKTYRQCVNDYIMGYDDENSPSIEILQKQVPELGVPEQEELERLLKLGGLVVNRQADSLASLIEREISGLTPSALKMYAFAFRTISWGKNGPVPDNYGELGSGLVKLTVDKMRKEAETITAPDLRDYLLSVISFKGNIEEEDRRWLIGLSEKIVSQDSTLDAAKFVRFNMKRLK